MNRILGSAWVLLTMVTAASAQSCPCDCNDDSSVRVHELATGINIALERMEMDRCPAADRDGSMNVEITELVSGVDAALNGCAPPLPTPTPDLRPTQDDLDAARAAWTKAGYNHYEYRYFLGCFCFGPHDVVLEVLEGDVVEIRDPETGQALNIEFADLYFTVDQLFDRIESELVDADTLRVEFDPDTGHPLDYYADRILEVADDELSIRISSLQPVRNPCSSTDDCDDFAEICVAPGKFVGCGVCFDGRSDCANDSDCNGQARICEPIGLNPRTCACDPSVLVCQPGCQCDTECPIGSACAPDNHCVASRCPSDESCPAHFECRLPPDSRTGQCRRRDCTGAADCPAGGFCVERQCYPRPGRCEVVPP